MNKYVEWEMQGLEYVNCNCAWGCPCQFNGLPTHGNCRAAGFVQIDQGRFGEVPLDWSALGRPDGLAGCRSFRQRQAANHH